MAYVDEFERKWTHQDTHKHNVNFSTRVRARRCSGCVVVVVGLQRWSWQIARYSSQDVMLRTRELGVWARTQAHRQREACWTTRKPSLEVAHELAGVGRLV